MKLRPCHLAAPCIAFLAGCSLLLDARPKEGDTSTDDVIDVSRDETAVEDLPDIDRIEDTAEADPDGVNDTDAEVQEEDGSPPPDVSEDEVGELCDVTYVLECHPAEKDTYANRWDEPPAPHGSSESLEISRHSTGTVIERTFLQFDLSDLESYTDVRKAELLLYYASWDGAELGDTRAVVYEITEPWVENTMLWADQPGVGPTPVSSTLIVEGETLVPECIWDITPTLRRWLDRSLENNGIMIEPDSERWYQFHSGNYGGDPSKVPCLRVTIGDCP